MGFRSGYNLLGFWLGFVYFLFGFCLDLFWGNWVAME
jgi:hypothetical protein